MVSRRAAVLIPTHNHPTTLPSSLRTALAQTVSDIEVHVLGDGVGDDTREVVAAFQRLDRRVVFHDHPKGPRNGEAYRDQLVRSIDAPLITYLCDDDLFLPEHIEVMEDALAGHDIAFSLQVFADIDDVVVYWPADAADAEYLGFTMGGGPGRVLSRMSLTGTAHTRNAYERLPFGWRTTPTGIGTDTYMWMQFLAQDWCRPTNARVATRLGLPSPKRRKWSAAELGAEIQRWERRVLDPGLRPDLDREIVEAFRIAAVRADRRLHEMENTRWWRVRALAVATVRRAQARLARAR